MAYLVEQAGGQATTGTKRILEIMPTQIHERQEHATLPLLLASAVAPPLVLCEPCLP